MIMWVASCFWVLPGAYTKQDVKLRNPEGRVKSEMLNLVEFLFLSMGATTVLLGSLVNFLEPYLPKFVSRTFRYGKFGGGGSYKDRSWMASLEIPKSKFKHFYAFALLWGAGGLYLGICAYLSGRPIPPFVNSLLDLLISPHRTVESRSSL